MVKVITCVDDVDLRGLTLLRFCVNAALDTLTKEMRVVQVLCC